MNLRDEINKLSPAERILLAEDIWDNLDEENKAFLSDEKKQFLDERLEAIQSGNASFVSLDEIKKALQLSEMRFLHRIEDVAAAQLIDAALWYEDRREGLGNELILCFEEAVEVICKTPFFQERYKNLRLYNTKRFPYQIIYYIEENMVTLVAFFHAKRNPKDWRKLYRK